MALPITDTIIGALAKILDDSKSSGEYREPSHSEIGFQVRRAGLSEVDPKEQGQTIGKAKRVRAILTWALENNVEAGSKLIVQLLSQVRAAGGFRVDSPNFVGEDPIKNAMAAFESEGFLLLSDGTIQPKVLDNLQGRELTAALAAYARRAQKGVEDAALMSGTGKDLLEATAAHIINIKWGARPKEGNFRSILGQAYIALGLTVPEQEPTQGEPPMKALERSMFQAACAINTLRNRQGTGHGRPWVTSLSETDAKAAVEMVGCVVSFLLGKLDAK